MALRKKPREFDRWARQAAQPGSLQTSWMMFPERPFENAVDEEPNRVRA
jgi:hypothetical protein